MRLCTSASSATLYRRRRTRFAHQRWAIQQRGLREFDPVIEQRLADHLHPRTRATLSRGWLEQAAREWLYRAYVAIPRPRTITVLVSGVVQSVALQDHRDLRRYMTEYSVQGFITELVSPRPAEHPPQSRRRRARGPVPYCNANPPILQLLTKLNLHGDGDGGNGLGWLDGIYDDGITTFYLDKAPAWARRWKTLIEESDTQTSARGYEAATAQ